MSEPSTTGKVIISTSRGDLEVELWCKEVPDSCRRFLDNCINGRYNEKRFTRIVPNQLVQVEDIEDTSEPVIRDEYNSRIRFQRAYLAITNDDTEKRNQHSCRSFFITLDSIPEFNGKYNIIGKVVGDSYYNLVKIGDGEMENGVPLYPAKIAEIKIAIKYFEDLHANAAEVPRKAIKKRKIARLKVKMAYEEEESEEDDFQMKNLHAFGDSEPKKVPANVPETVETKTEDSDRKEANTGQKSNNSGSLKPPLTESTVPQEPQPESPSKPQLHESHEQNNEKLQRNPAIDSDYDSDLDYSNDISIDIVKSHKFIVKG